MRKSKRPYDSVLQAIRDQLTYDPETGIIYRKGKPTGRAMKRKDDLRYRLIDVRTHDPDYLSVQCILAAHQVAWYLYHGTWPDTDKVIDHIDGDGSNNRIANLRLATQTENACNVRKRKTGYKGVTYHRRDKRWQANITLGGKKHYLGSFTTELAAAQAYDKGAKELHGEFARLNFPETLAG